MSYVNVVLAEAYISTVWRRSSRVEFLSLINVVRLFVSLKLHVKLSVRCFRGSVEAS